MRQRMWAGLESKGIAPMGPELRAHVADRARRVGRWRFVWLAMMLALGLTPCALARLVDGSVAGVVFLFAMFVGAVACVLAAGDAQKRYRGLHADAKRGEVEVFEGTVGVATTAVSETIVRLLDRGELGEGTARVEVLPVSGYLASIDGKLRSDFIVPDVLEVAPGRTPAPVDRATLEEGSRAIALTDEEREEMRARASQLWRTPASLLGPVLYAALAVIAWRAHAGDAGWLARYWVMALIAGGVGTLSLIGLAMRYRSAVRVGQDAASGKALEVIEADPDGVLHRIVVLPRSGMVWSVDELPAEWRSRKT